MLAQSSRKRNVTFWRPSVCPWAHSPWLTRGQHATRPAYISVRHTCFYAPGLRSDEKQPPSTCKPTSTAGWCGHVSDIDLELSWIVVSRQRAPAGRQEPIGCNLALWTRAIRQRTDGRCTRRQIRLIHVAMIHDRTASDALQSLLLPSQRNRVSCSTPNDVTLLPKYAHTPAAISAV